MKNSNFIILLSVYALVQVLNVSNAEPYEYMQFVLQYPPGVCYDQSKGHCISPLPTKFHVHGIWPSNFSNTLVRCGHALRNNPFHKVQMTPLQTDLGNSWPSVLTQNNNMQFWEHEYREHGACAVESGVPPFTQRSYFEKGHQLWNQYDILAVLRQSGIKPGTATSYTMTQLVTAIQKKIGSNNTPLIMCRRTALGYTLKEVIICLDHQATNVISCALNNIRKTDCRDPSGKVYYVA
ncbi:putative ribonuclease T(2) [Rosa chinensis]|uniref:Putative ribonuclease T(2) n=1 Tax=Rosa chinensis TaxID=74649 RepID=A0A2P6RPZ6_ROSCH|nr:putative ribonuclease T(2) [Rosa chinensis]